METLRFRSFRGRLVAVFVGLFAVVLAISLLVVAAFVRAAARYEIGEELRLASTLFVRQLDARSQQLVGATRLLSGDFALKTAVATADHETTRSVLENHRRRIGADVLMLVSLAGAITADTRPAAHPGAVFALPRLLEEAEQTQDPTWVVPLDGGLVRLTIVPVLAPDPIAWLCAGFSIDDRTAAELRRLTGLQVSFLRRQGAGFTVHASTLDRRPSGSTSSMAWPTPGRQGSSSSAASSTSRGPSRSPPTSLVVLQRPLGEALALLPTACSGSWRWSAAPGCCWPFSARSLVARRVSRPVLALAGAARRVAAGDFDTAVAVRQS